MLSKKYTVSILVLFCISLCEESLIGTIGYHREVGIPKAEYLWKYENWSTLLRIVGGSPVDSNNHIPYQAGLLITLTTGWISVCGASLVSNTRLLTAAHCWNDGVDQARQFTVVLGSVTIFTGGLRVATSDVVVHPNWNPVGVIHDIAMIRIHPIVYTNTIQPIALPLMMDASETFAGMPAVASGYGKTSDAQNNIPVTTTLFEVTLEIMTNSDCQTSLNYGIHGSHLCTSGYGRVGTCDGDSGGPLAVIWRQRRTLVGITSFGLGEGCQHGLPSVFTRVTAFLGWIQAHL